MSLMGKVEEVVVEHNLCLECLGRMFAGLSAKLSNRERGRALTTVLSMTLSMEMLEGREERRPVVERLARRVGTLSVRSVAMSSLGSIDTST
jgi:tRNA U54 and U55 pseudouridine synthase Pus10